MRLATYNVDNLFDRPLALPAPGQTAQEDILASYARISELIAHESYAPIKDEIVHELEALDLASSDEGPYAILRQNHGRLVERHDGRPAVAADGRASWMGWVELKTKALPDEAVKNAARVIADQGADIQAVAEVESRAVLRTFAKDLVRPKDGQRYEHAMEIEGKDHREINVGLLTRHGWEITDMRSHVDDKHDNKDIFSRDCPEYTITHAPGTEIVVLVNHFKSQIGSKRENDAKRSLQSTRVAEIYHRLRGEGHDYVAIVGDLNAAPDSPSLKPLLETDLFDVADLPGLDDGTLHEPGSEPLLATYRDGKQRFDYILLSPPLRAHLQGAGIYRKGTWTETGDWEMYDTIDPRKKGAIQNAASDHALVYADFDF